MENVSINVSSMAVTQYLSILLIDQKTFCYESNKLIVSC